MLMRLAEEMGFRIATFQQVLEGYRVAKEIAAHGAGASTFSDWWGYKVEAADAIPYNAAIRLGSLESGKIANLIVTDGDLFEEKTRIRYVFVDGRSLTLEDEQPEQWRDGGRGGN